MCRCFHWILWLANDSYEFSCKHFSLPTSTSEHFLRTRVYKRYTYSFCVSTIYVNFSHCLFTNFNNVVDLQFKLIGQLYWVWWFWHRKMKQAVINIISTPSVVVYMCKLLVLVVFFPNLFSSFLFMYFEHKLHAAIEKNVLCLIVFFVSDRLQSTTYCGNAIWTKTTTKSDTLKWTGQCTACERKKTHTTKYC